MELHEGIICNTATSQGRTDTDLLTESAVTYTNETAALQHGRQQLIKQRSVARGMLSHIQNFIEVGDQKINEIQVRSNKLTDIFNRYDAAQSELEISDDR